MHDPLQGVIGVRSTPGVLSSFDERGCVVVDTLRDRWLYLTGDEAWVWQSVEVTGSADHLQDPEDIETLHYFIETGLLMMEDDTTSVPFASLDPGGYEYEIFECHTTFAGARPSRLAIHRAWLGAVSLHRRPMHRILQRMRFLRNGGHHYLTEKALCELRTRMIDSTPWWVERTHHINDRSVAIVTCLAAHAVGARVDLSFGMSHEARFPVWWCSVPEGPAGRPDDTLAVSTV